MGSTLNRIHADFLSSFAIAHDVKKDLAFPFSCIGVNLKTMPSPAKWHSPCDDGQLYTLRKDHGPCTAVDCCESTKTALRACFANLDGFCVVAACDGFSIY